MAAKKDLRTSYADAARRVASVLLSWKNVGKLSLGVSFALVGATALPAANASDASERETLVMFRTDDGSETTTPVTEQISNAANGESEEENAGLLSNIRPFKRARERFFGEKTTAAANAPAPPTVEALDPEKQELIAHANPPVITLTSATLPPLDPQMAQNASEELATRADIEALREESKGLAWKKGDLKITPYGFLNLSVSSDTQRAVPGEYILYLQNPAVDSSSDFTVDARTSRLGLKIEGPRIEQLNSTLGGCAEFDFQGVYSGSKNKGGVQLRRAYAELLDVQHERRFLAGQDWEIISPGAPMMLNYLPATFAGNMQYRRGQLRFEQGWTCSSNVHLLGQIAACDNVLGDYTSTAGISPASAGWPIIEGRVAAALLKDARNGLPITVGLSGHIGEQYFNFQPLAGTSLTNTERKAIKTWSANLDYDVPITETFKLQGEYYIGSDLSSFCGAINQGVDLYRREGIDASGWWVALHKDWTKQFSTNVGHGIEKPEDGDLVATSLPSGGKTSSRTKNEIYFVNFLYNWSANFMTGIEFSYWETGYKTMDVTGASPIFLSKDTAKALRTEFTTRLSF